MWKRWRDDGSIQLPAQVKSGLSFAAAFALYFFTRSPGLDEWDSVQFAFGTLHFDLWQSQPHPPGYPLFIFFGWLTRRLFGWEPVWSLHLASALGGALFVSAWFQIAREQFSERFAWLIALTLAVMPIVWMTSTKVMTDSLATGLFSAELLHAFRYRRIGDLRDMIAMALFGAAAAGVRPQFAAIAIVLMVGALWQKSPPPRLRWVAPAIFFAASLCWLLPMWILQWKLRPELSFWQVYPQLLFRQWSWRLVRPELYIGAGGWDPVYLWNRFRDHIWGWFDLGFGFSYSRLTLTIGSLLAVLGGISYGLRRPGQDREFWRLVLPWAVLHVALIFSFLPWDQRYYLPIFPLLLVVLQLGVLRLPRLWKGLAAAWPALLLYVSVPLAVANATVPAPPIQFAEYLKHLYPPAERSKVLLISYESQRHLEWYAPGFEIATNVRRLADLDPALVTGARAIYTDEEQLRLPPEWHLVLLKSFTRVDLISPKQNGIDVFRVENPNSELGEQVILKRSQK